MKPKFEKTLKVISNTLVILAVVLAFLLCGFQLFGLKPYSVLSGSMASVYPTGSLIYVAEVNPAELEVNDIITFRMAGGTVATHRIIELVPDETQPDIIRFRTKGDENEIADGTLVEFDGVIGTPLFGIPLLGFLATYIMSAPGRYVAITAAVVIILIEIMISIALDDKNKKKSEAQKE